MTEKEVPFEEMIKIFRYLLQTIRCIHLGIYLKERKKKVRMCMWSPTERTIKAMKEQKPNWTKS